MIILKRTNPRYSMYTQKRLKPAKKVSVLSSCEPAHHSSEAFRTEQKSGDLRCSTSKAQQENPHRMALVSDDEVTDKKNAGHPIG